jgi:ubiquinone/menaquinone biosynthesis C-methylase UbiE
MLVGPQRTMSTETYTPGHTRNATDFMSRRTFESHGQFFASHLCPGARVLDCGCGPGTITIGIASAVAPGLVVGVDFAESQIEKARSNAAVHGAKNASFQTASCYALPFADFSFDGCFVMRSWNTSPNPQGPWQNSLGS